MEFALQLWSLTGEIEKDYKGALRKLAKMGYGGVEFAGYGGLDAKEMKALLDETGLVPVSSHTGYYDVEKVLPPALEYNKAIGSNYILYPRHDWKDDDDLKDFVERLNKATEMARPYGIKVGYHNHDHEFQKIGDTYVLDYIFENTPDDFVVQPDIHWIKYAGLDPVEYIKKWGSRVELVHLKQIGPNKERCDLSEGTIDMKEIIEVSKYAKHFIIEQEGYNKPIWESTKNNIDYMKELMKS